MFDLAKRNPLLTVYKAMRVLGLPYVNEGVQCARFHSHQRWTKSVCRFVPRATFSLRLQHVHKISNPESGLAQ